MNCFIGAVAFGVWYESMAAFFFMLGVLSIFDELAENVKRR